MRQLNEEAPIRAWLVPGQCAAGLAIVALIAFVGGTGTDRKDNLAQTKGSVPIMQRAEQHRQAVFNQRRENYQRQEGGGRLARPAQPAQSAPLTAK